MKKLREIADLQTSCAILVKPCDDFIEKNKESYWANFSLYGRSPVQIVKDLKADLKSQTSIEQLICKIKEYKQDQKLTKKLRELAVTKIYQTSQEVVNELGKDIARQNLVAASRGFSLSVATNPAPDVDAAIDQLFLEYWGVAKSISPPPSIELGTK